MKGPARATVALLALMLGACAVVPKRLPERPLAPPGAAPAREFQQGVAVDYRDHHFQLLVAGRIDADAVQLAALSPAGFTLFTLRYDGVKLDVQQRAPAQDNGAGQLPPAQIVADLQLVYWPLAALNAAGAPHWRVTERPGERVLSWDGTPVERATFAGGDPWRAPVRLEHLRYGYRLTITTLAP